MLESAFSSVSISGNRPPALSVSSISSIGEDLNQKGMDLSSYYASSGAPSSPMSSASVRSHFYGTGSAIGSPTTAPNYRYEGSRTPNDLSESNPGLGSHNPKYASFDSSGFALGSHKSLPTFKEHNSDCDQSFFSNDSRTEIRRNDKSQSFQDFNFNGFSKPRRSTSDLSESSNTAAFGNCQPSNMRMANSLINMGSLDENEQYLGNRVRSASATAALGYSRTLSSSNSFSNNPGYQEDYQHNYNQSSNGYSQFATHNHDSAVPHPRQRLLSADAVQSRVNGSRSSYESSHSMGSNSFNQYPHSSNHLNEHNNRPRSFSSGNTTYATGPKYNNLFHPNNYVIDSSSRPASYLQGPTTDVNRMDSVQVRFFLQCLGFHQFIIAFSYHVIIHSLKLNESQYYNHHSSQPGNASRAFVYEQQYRADGGYANQDRFIRVQQGKRPTDNTQVYYQNLDFQKPTPRTVYTVKFKRSQKNFFLSENIRGDIKIGSYVKVEADRGEDLGIILSRIPIEKFNPGARLNTPNMDIPDLQLKRITALASESDIALLGLKEEEEAELLKICRNKTLQRGLPMNVVDAEYQFDRHKLTFFFEASCRVDFRELVRDLFSIYKTRIWMQQIDKVPGSLVPGIAGGNDNSLRFGSERSGLIGHNVLLGNEIDSLRTDNMYTSTLNL